MAFSARCRFHYAYIIVIVLAYLVQCNVPFTTIKPSSLRGHLDPPKRRTPLHSPRTQTQPNDVEPCTLELRLEGPFSGWGGRPRLHVRRISIYFWSSPSHTFPPSHAKGLFTCLRFKGNWCVCRCVHTASHIEVCPKPPPPGQKRVVGSSGVLSIVGPLECGRNGAELRVGERRCGGDAIESVAVHVPMYA